ncbi:hypothetical protein G6F24_013351 [Rhizopus arrhizus]|nr:hypothetical protein G6F24_013351 [Rhizopus arrhizus]
MVLAAQLVLSTLAGYAFARFEFRGRDFVFMLVLLQLMIAEALQSPGVQRLTLRVYRDNAAAVALYRDFGFQPVDDASTPDLLFMQRGGG